MRRTVFIIALLMGVVCAKAQSLDFFDLGNDYSIILKQVKAEYEKWMEKDEFEKNANYSEKLKNQSGQYFYKLCQKVTDSYIKENILPKLYIKNLSTYNAESETFTIEIARRGTDASYRYCLPVPLDSDKAKIFKNIYEKQGVQIECNGSWCLENKAILPESIIAIANSKFSGKIIGGHCTPITIAFSSLGIDNQYAQDCIFEFNETRSELQNYDYTIVQEGPETEVRDVAEQMPSFPGGSGALMSYLSQNVKYPVEAQKNGVQGRVVVSFIVERDGSISDVNVVRSVDPSLDKEAVRVIKSMPRWIPGKQDGKTVRVKYNIPLSFKFH